MIRHLPVAIVIAVTLCASPARAETMPKLTAEQSASLTRAVRMWSSGLPAIAAKWTATPSDGYYDVRVPVAGEVGIPGLHYEGEPISLRAVPQTTGAWRFESIRLPSPLRLFELDRLRETTIIQKQQGSATIEAASSRMTTDLVRDGFRREGQGARTTSLITFERSASHEEWVPTSRGAVDTASVTTAETVTLSSATAHGDIGQDSGRVIRGRKLTSSFVAKEADPDRVAPFLRDALVLFSAPGLSGSGPVADQKIALRRLLAASRDLARAATLSLSIDGGTLSQLGRDFSFDHATFMQTLTHQDASVDLRARLDLVGLDAAFVPKGKLHDLIPRRVAAAVFVSDPSIDDVYAMADELIVGDIDKTAMDKRYARLAKRPLTIGMDELAFDIGPAAISGHGRLTARGADDVDGTAVVEAAGLGELIRQAKNDPLLGMGVAGLIFLKGLGEQRGDKVVWDIAYKNGALTVNGQSALGLIPGLR